MSFVLDDKRVRRGGEGKDGYGEQGRAASRDPLQGEARRGQEEPAQDFAQEGSEHCHVVETDRRLPVRPKDYQLSE